MNRQRTGIPNTRFFSLSASLLLMAGALPAVTPRTGLADDEFSKVPFAKWAEQGKHSQIHWSVDVGPTALSTHQRFLTKVVVTVDGRELERRRGKGEFLILVQYEDPDGALWQTHVAVDLATLQPGIQSRDAEFTFYAFILPGSYSLRIAVCNLGTPDYSFQVHRLHVAEMKDDPLPDAWQGLPRVEFVSANSGVPDIWYLPEIETRLNLPVRTHRPVHVELLVNTTPSEYASGSVAALRRNMSLLIPAVKLLSGLKIESGSIDVSLLDLTHHRAIRANTWRRMSAFFQENNPGVIDVRALERQKHMRQFFADEVVRRLNAPGDDARIVIVLSGPAFFENQEPAEMRAVAGNADRRLIYIRSRSTTNPFAPRPRPRPGARPALPQRNIAMPVDDLERSLEPLNARLYDSASAEQFRRILAAVLQQIAAM